MSHVFSPTAVKHTSVTLPDDGDDADAASVNGPFEDLAENTRYLISRTPGSTTETAWHLPLNFTVTGDGTGWSRAYLVGNVTGWRHDDKTTLNTLLQDLTGILPIGVTLTKLTLHSKAAAHGALPATLPSIIFRELDTTPTDTYSVSQSDTSVLATFTNYHSYDLTISRLISSSRRYVVELTGEAGANSADGAIYYGLTAAWTEA